MDQYIRQHSSGVVPPQSTIEELAKLYKSMKNKEEAIQFLQIGLKVKVDIAVLGKSAVGKSSFINKMRNVKRGDEGFASIGFGDETRRPTRYSMPKDEMIALWDMPGIATLDFKMNEEYLEKTIEVDKYDFFLVMYCTNIDEVDIWLIKQLIKRNKPFAVVRTKADELTDADLGCSFDDLVRQVKEKARRNMEKASITRSVEIFVISSKNISVGEFNHFFEFLLNQLPYKKRMAMIMSVDRLTPDIIMKKKESLKYRKWLVAGLIGSVDALPHSGLAFPVNLAIVQYEVNNYLSMFGLDSKTIDKIPLCYHSVLKVSKEMEYEGLRNYISKALSETPTREVLKIIAEISVEEIVKYIWKQHFDPFPLINGVSTFLNIVDFLDEHIELLAEEANELYHFRLSGCIHKDNEEL